MRPACGWRPYDPHPREAEVSADHTKNAARTVAVVGAFDTRGDEIQFLRSRMAERGLSVVTIDTGVMGAPFCAADCGREAVARAGGRSLADLIEAARSGADRMEATGTMSQGAARIVRDLHGAGRLDAVVVLGGSTAAATAAVVMRDLPVGVPKLLVTTFLSFAPAGIDDLAVLTCPVDLVGLNRVVARTLDQAAGAVAGMLQGKPLPHAEKPLAALTALGVTTPAVRKLCEKLGTLGYDTLVFHATTEKLDRMARDGLVDILLDITTFEWVPKVLYSEETLALFSAFGRPDRNRLDAAFQKGIPLVLAPGGLDMHIFPGASGPDQIPPQYRGRHYSMHGPSVVLVRTSAEELARIARTFADRANRACGPIGVVIPLAGFSEASRPGAALHDPVADEVFRATLRDLLRPDIPVTEAAGNINDECFVDAAIRVLEQILRRKESPWRPEFRERKF